ncbi:hypothetical protein Tco_1461211 [Tanacetum coccineum]
MPIAQLVLGASLEFYSGGLEFDYAWDLVVNVHVSIHVDATWAHVDPRGMPRGRPDPAHDSIQIQPLTGGPAMVNGGSLPLTVVDHRR